MKLREQPSTARLDWLDHLLVGSAVRQFRSAPDWPFREYRDEVMSRSREHLEADLSGVMGAGRAECLRALALLRAGREIEAFALLDPLLERGPDEM